MKWDVSVTSLSYFLVPNWGASVKHPAAIGEKQPFRIIAANGPTLPPVLGNTCLVHYMSDDTTRPGVSPAAAFTNNGSINPDAVCVLDSHRLL